MAGAVEFDAVYNEALLLDAATLSVRRHYRRYGLLLGAACVVNLVGAAFFLKLTGYRISAASLVVLGLAVLGPAYFLWSYFRGPRSYARAFGRSLLPSVRVTVDPSRFSISLGKRTLTKPWSEYADIIERPEYFLLLRNKFLVMAVPLSKNGAPEAALETIRAAARMHGSESKEVS